VVGSCISEQSRAESSPRFTIVLTDRSGYGEIHFDTPYYDAIRNRIINDQYGTVVAVVKAKCNVITEITARSRGKFLLDANDTDGRAVPLCRRS
jgi:hypothetical protein